MNSKKGATSLATTLLVMLVLLLVMTTLFYFIVSSGNVVKEISAGIELSRVYEKEKVLNLTSQYPVYSANKKAVA